MSEAGPAGRFSEPAPLLAAPRAPVPPGAEALWFEGADGLRLRAALFQPTATLRGSVVLSPGRTEFIEKYFEVARELQGRGWVVLVHDWRGQGLSDREHPDRLAGHASGFVGYLADFERLLDHSADRLPKPWIALAHSMGGGLTTLALARGLANRFAGVVLTAPMFAVTPRVAPLLIAGACAAQIATGGGRRYALRLEPGGHGTRLTRDEKRLERWRGQIKAHPDLALGGLTWGWLDMAMRLTRALTPPTLAGLTIPALVSRAAVEDLVDNRVMERVVAAMPDARLIDVPDSWHEVMMERDEARALFWREFDEFAERVAPRG